MSIHEDASMIPRLNIFSNMNINVHMTLIDEGDHIFWEQNKYLPK